jgi:hypothetical protein
MVWFSMRRRRFQSSRSGFWRDRFVQIAREIDASASDAAAAGRLAPRDSRRGRPRRTRPRKGLGPRNGLIPVRFQSQEAGPGPAFLCGKSLRRGTKAG